MFSETYPETMCYLRYLLVQAIIELFTRDSNGEESEIYPKLIKDKMQGLCYHSENRKSASAIQS